MTYDLPKTRKEAILIGSELYYSGPCKRGHDAPKLTKKAHCTECKRLDGLKRYQEHRQEIIDKAVAWNKNNPERRSEICADYYINNLDDIKDRREGKYSEWYYGNHEENKLSKRIRFQNRKAKIRKNGGSFTKQDIEDIMKMQQEKCAVCSTSLLGSYHIDHIIPVSKGGHSNRSNLQLLCMPCNVSKKDQDPIDFMRKRGRLL